MFSKYIRDNPRNDDFGMHKVKELIWTLQKKFKEIAGFKF